MKCEYQHRKIISGTLARDYDTHCIRLCSPETVYVWQTWLFNYMVLPNTNRRAKKNTLNNWLSIELHYRSPGVWSWHVQQCMVLTGKSRISRVWLLITGSWLLFTDNWLPLTCILVWIQPVVCDTVTCEDIGGSKLSDDRCLIQIMNRHLISLDVGFPSHSKKYLTIK